MTDDPTAPEPTVAADLSDDSAPEDSSDPEAEATLDGDAGDLEAADDDEDGPDPLAAPVPEPPPPHDEKEPEPVPPALWESDADHLDPTAPIPRDRAPDIDPTKLDPDALKVVNRLLQYGHQAYLVGGCVRDLLVGRTPKDFDVATSAAAQRGARHLPQLPAHRPALPAGARLLQGGKIIEVSTFRANPSELEDPAESQRDGRGERTISSSATTTSSAPPSRTRAAATSPSTASSTTSRRGG